jgi:hypothetical protein
MFIYNLIKHFIGVQCKTFDLSHSYIGFPKPNQNVCKNLKVMLFLARETFFLTYIYLYCHCFLKRILLLHNHLIFSTLFYS